MGGFILRGEHVAERLGWDVIELDRERPTIDGHYDAIVLIKYDLGHAGLLRKHCDRLVWDPIDAFTQWGPASDACAFWTWAESRIPFDTIIATSPACEVVMRAALQVRDVWLLPHAADPRVQPMQRSERGDVVYWGGRQYIESVIEPINRACEAIERRFVIDERKGPWQHDGPVAVALHLRTHPFDSDVMRRCKPQVKLANASAAGLPVLATYDPCVWTLCENVRTIDARDCCRPILLASRIAAAACDAPPAPAVTLDEHCRNLAALLGA